MPFASMVEAQNRVLLVDDEMGVLEVLKSLVVDQGYDVLTATSGTEALDLLKDTSVALVVCDYRMPRMNGVEFLKIVHKESPHTVRMLISGFAEANDAISAINEGYVDRYMPKPWDNQEMQTAIRNSMERYKLATENDQLREALSFRNLELQNANETLEQKVKERTAELLMHNTALRFAHEVLDNLPYALFGVDSEMNLATVNKAGMMIAGLYGVPMIGFPIAQSLAPEAGAFIEKVLEDGRPQKGSFLWANATLWAECVPLGEKPQRGAILILKKE